MKTRYLRHLAHFVVAVEVGSVTGAARRLGLSPSGVSDSIKALEAHFGQPLLERQRSGLVPLPKGQSVYEEARPIVSALTRVFGPEDSMAGEVNISLPTELAGGWFNGAIARLSETHPGLTLKLHCEDKLVDHTRFSRDLHIRVGSGTPDKGMKVLYQTETRVALAASPKLLAGRDPNDSDDLSDLPLLASVDWKQPSFALTDGTVFQPGRVIRVSSIMARIALGRAGVGVLACLRPTLEDDFAVGRLMTLLEQRYRQSAKVVFGTPHRPVPKAVQAVAEAFAADLGAVTQ